MADSHKTVYDMLMDHMRAAERVNQVSFFDTITRSVCVGRQYPGVQVPMNQPMRWPTAKGYLQKLKHDNYCPRIRIDTTFRSIFISPSPLAQSLDHNGYLEPFTLAVTEELAAT